MITSAHQHFLPGSRSQINKSCVDRNLVDQRVPQMKILRNLVFGSPGAHDLSYRKRSKIRFSRPCKKGLLLCSIKKFQKKQLDIWSLHEILVSSECDQMFAMASPSGG